MNAEIRARTLLVKSLVRGVVDVAILCGVLFGIAGRVDWPAAWLIVLVFTGHLVLSGWWLFRHDPELLKERLTTAPNVPQWDRRIARANWILLPIFLATAALDAGRFGWSAMPIIVRAIGTAAAVAAVGVIWWCARCKSFPVGQIEDPERTWAYSRPAWSLSFRPASAVRVAHCPHHRSGIDVRVVDRAGASRLERSPAGTADLVGRSHAHDGTARLSGICEARSRAPRTRPVVTIGCTTVNCNILWLDVRSGRQAAWAGRTSRIQTKPIAPAPAISAGIGQ